MKKALFKPNSKVFENFEFPKLQEMLLKKINYFYKTYIRYLKKINNTTDNSRIYELINQDINNYNKHQLNRFCLTRENLSETEFDDCDMKNLMIIEFFRGLGGRNPLLKTSTIIDKDKMERFLTLDDGGEEGGKEEEKQLLPYSDDYLTFNELSMKDKIELLFFFCNYSLTFSGRASFFKDELLSTNVVKEVPTNTELQNQATPVKVSVSSLSSLSMNTFKRIKPLGIDENNNKYYSLLCNKECRIYKEDPKDTTYSLQLIVRNYEELEKFMSSLESSQEEQTLLKSIRENLLYYKEFDEEEKKKEAGYMRKQQAMEKAKLLNSTKQKPGEIEKSDYFLMNISDHVITRNQLNQITKTNYALANNNFMQNRKEPPVQTEEERKKQKIEKEKLERQKRLEKRNRVVERTRNIYREEEDSYSDYDGKMTGNKRQRKLRSSKGGVKRSLRSRRERLSSEEEYDSKDDSENNQSLELDLPSDRDDDEENPGMQIEIPIQNGEHDRNSDIVVEGFLIYRYGINQLELEGSWYMSSEPAVKERLSYLFMKPADYYIDMNIDRNEIHGQGEQLITNNKIKICTANLFECIIINRQNVFEHVLSYLTGEYSGYFMYYGKTIEDRVTLQMSLQESLVRVSGEGTNNLGNFNVIGYMNFYRTKENLLEKNDLDNEYIKFAEFKLTKIYTAFNPNENYRVIKSFQHRRKKADDEF
jgi:hypothetical protein